MQEDATRAWNLFTALYYKAGGLPWQLTPEHPELTWTNVLTNPSKPGLAPVEAPPTDPGPWRWLAIGAAALAVGWLVAGSGDDDSSASAVLDPSAIACQVDEVTAPNSAMSVPLVVVAGNQVVDDPPVAYRDVLASATLNVGDEFESQGFLQLVIVDAGGLRPDSTLYDYEVEDQPGPINILNVDTGTDSLRLQCWIDR